MPYIIYRLDFSDGKCYIGMTTNLARRVREHRRGKTLSTKNKSIVRVIELERCEESFQARNREKYWKSGQGRKQLATYSGVEQSGSSSGS